MFIFKSTLKKNSIPKYLKNNSNTLLNDFNKHISGSIVNDPNMKRLELRYNSGEIIYGMKAELLMVTDGGQVREIKMIM